MQLNFGCSNKYKDDFFSFSYILFIIVICTAQAMCFVSGNWVIDLSHPKFILTLPGRRLLQ
jgi:hypothetical protein